MTTLSPFDCKDTLANRFFRGRKLSKAVSLILCETQRIENFMLPAPIPPNEDERIASLRRMLLLVTPDEESFDRVTRVAQQLFKVPIVLVSLIDENRQWFKSCIGLSVRETGRDVSFCGHAIMNKDLFVIEDARLDPRFADNPLVTSPPHVIFYAGRPLSNSDGHMIGTLCVFDHEPREFSPADRRALTDLGFWLESIFLNRELSETQLSVINELEDARRGAMLDPMLNIWTRDMLLELCDREVSRAFAGKRPLSVTMISFENIDEIRNEYGEQAANEALIEGTKALRTVQRSYDTLGRYSENKFVVIQPDADTAIGRELASRMRKLMDYPVLINDRVIELSLSIGVASADYVQKTPNAADLIEAASSNLPDRVSSGGPVAHNRLS